MMIEELAVVVKIENNQVWVESRQNSGCGGCQQKTSCTTNALGSVLKKKAVPVDSDFLLQTGDTVTVGIDEKLLVHASLLLYFVPLLALFSGAGLADWLLPSNMQYLDLLVAVSALAGFLLSLWLINKVQQLFLLGYYVHPVVIKKV
jgi:sigma-E factor negative regulatory protein RseC